MSLKWSRTFSIGCHQDHCVFPKWKLLEFAASDLLKVIFILSIVFVLNTPKKNSIDRFKRHFWQI